MLVVLCNSLFHACRVQGIAILPCCYPWVGALEIKLNAAVASDIGDHLVALDSRAIEKLEPLSLGILRHDLACSTSWAEGDIAVAVLVDDEHIRSCHLSSSA
ncbi:hypothetical protein HG530_004796 [Fusarium avenaceum]|nr:hypothetical protein HG530_004796 [Fusarium avenaceum]